jgi:hypothetical protein
MSGPTLDPAVLTRTPAAGERLLDGLGLLIKADAVYRSEHERTRKLAERCAQAVRELGDTEAAVIGVHEQELSIGDLHVPAAGIRESLLEQLTHLNVKTILLAADIDAPALLSFAAHTNENLRILMCDPDAARPCWDGLPESITIFEHYFTAGVEGGEEDGATTAEPEDLSRCIATIVEQLGRIRQALVSIEGRTTREVDIVGSLLERFRSLDTGAPQQVEELVVRALDRFARDLTRADGHGLTVRTRRLLQEVSRKFFKRRDLSLHALEAESSGPPEPGPHERTPVKPLAPDILTVLRKAAAVNAPAINAWDDRSWLGLLLQFLRAHEERKVVENVSLQIAAVLERSSAPGLHSAVQKTLLARMQDGLDCTCLSSLANRLFEAEGLASAFATLDLENEAGVQLLSRLVRSLWPESLLPMLERLRRETPRVRSDALAAAMREIGRENVLASRDVLLRSGLYDDKALMRSLLALRIPEVLPLLEVQFYAPDPIRRREALLAAQRFPFKQKAAFRLQAARDPSLVPVDYFRNLFRDEWEGRDRREFFDAVFEEECAKALDEDPGVAVPAIVALGCADTDEAANLLIGILTDRRLGLLPQHPRSVRDAARRALASMRCETAQFFRLRYRG